MVQSRVVLGTQGARSPQLSLSWSPPFHSIHTSCRPSWRSRGWWCWARRRRAHPNYPLAGLHPFTLYIHPAGPRDAAGDGGAGHAGGALTPTPPGLHTIHLCTYTPRRSSWRSRGWCWTCSRQACPPL